MKNGTMIQYFHWYNSDNGLWRELAQNAPWLASLGITAAWLPPAFKAASGTMSVGYDVYDLYDLGEFDQKGAVNTKYGIRWDYEQAIDALHANGIEAIVDIVVNHKAGGDETELVPAAKVNEEDRNEVLDFSREIECFTRFNFPGRQGKYSDFIWDHQCFTGTDYDHRTGETGIFSFKSEYGDGWEDMIDDEKGNYDYLMYCDIEFRNPAVREELFNWGRWYYEAKPFDGMRLDAVKHISPAFYNEWLDRMRAATGKHLFAVGEYWAPGHLDLLERYIDATDGRMMLFDSSLHHNLVQASKDGSAYDLREILKGSLVEARPEYAVTVVENHDTQPLQKLEAPVEQWFKPLAYGLILLRAAGYPCIFYPDLFGANYTDKGKDGGDYEIFLNKVDKIEALLKARELFAYGEQLDYFEEPGCIGWTRLGNDEHQGCAVVMSNGEGNSRRMEVGIMYAGRQYRDYLGNHDAEVYIGEDGFGDFPCHGGSISVWTAV